MKYIKLFENYSSSEEDEEYERQWYCEYEEHEKESIDDLKKLLIDLINKKFGGAMCTLESNPLNENLFTIKYYSNGVGYRNSEITSELKCEIKPYKNDPEVPYVVYIKNDDFEREKESPGIRGPWGFTKDRLPGGLADFIYDFLQYDHLRPGRKNRH
jgi:hypothetical protein